MVEIEGKITRNLSIEEERKVTRFLDAIAEAYCRYYYEEDKAQLEDRAQLEKDRTQLEQDYDSLKENDKADKAWYDC